MEIIFYVPVILSLLTVAGFSGCKRPDLFLRAHGWHCSEHAAVCTASIE